MNELYKQYWKNDYSLITNTIQTVAGNRMKTWNEKLTELTKMICGKIGVEFNRKKFNKMSTEKNEKSTQKRKRRENRYAKHISSEMIQTHTTLRD
eukprot:UN17567